MTLKVENLQAIERAVKRRLERIEPAFKEAVTTEKERIIARTQTGVDVNGRQFVAYSEKDSPYGRWKDVREANGKQTAFVDLKFSEDMFKAMQVAFRKEGFKFLATIFFNDGKQAKKAKGHQTGLLGRIKFQPRRFFGLSKTQRETIASKIRNAK